jgi:hypothetical protein
LVGAVEFEELIFLVGKMRFLAEKSLSDVTSQSATLGFNFFDTLGSHGG